MCVCSRERRAVPASQRRQMPKPKRFSVDHSQWCLRSIPSRPLVAIQRRKGFGTNGQNGRPVLLIAASVVLRRVIVPVPQLHTVVHARGALPNREIADRRLAQLLLHAVRAIRQ
ncbi:hypothetical protein OSTOST_04541 [Ostertagia ostertagi]